MSNRPLDRVIRALDPHIRVNSPAGDEVPVVTVTETPMIDVSLVLSAEPPLTNVNAGMVREGATN